MAKKSIVLVGFIALILCFTPAAYSTQDAETSILNASDKAVVTLIVYDAGNKEVGRGKAVIISPTGLVLTNYHLVSQAKSAKVEMFKEANVVKRVDWESIISPSVAVEGEADKKKKKPKMKTVDVIGITAVDKDLNLVVLKLKGKDFPSAPISSADTLGIGEKTLIVADAESAVEASITGTIDLSSSRIIAQSSIKFPPEWSGSPLFNSSGELTGIALSIGDITNMIFPASYAQSLLESNQTTSLSKQEGVNYFATAEGLYLKGLGYTMLEENTTAIGLFQESLNQKPNNPSALAQIGLLHSKLRQHDKAVEFFTQALNADPNNYKVSFGLGLAYIKLNKPEQAIAPLEQCTRTNPNFPDAFYNLGLAYQSGGQLEDAARSFEQFVKINPGPAWTGLNQLGSIYMQLNQYDKAIGAFNEVAKDNPQDLKAHYNLAQAHDNLRQYDQAATHYRKLIELNPKDAASYYNLLFRLYNKAEDFTNAVQVSQEILNQNPEDPQNHYNLGYAYLKQEDLPNALAAFQKALELNPDFDLAYSQIGYVHFKQKNYPEAVDALTKYTELKPDNPDVFYLLGTSYLQLKRYERALTPLEKCVELKEDHAYAHYNLGIAYYVLKDKYSANMKVEILQNLNPELAEKLRKIVSK
ncbi:tetratricopeptide repeat protein [Acidobacteriota bacterium]